MRKINIIKTRMQGQFNKSKLPCPIVVLTGLGILPGHCNFRGYWKIRCPFHKNGNEKNPSLNLHYIDGHFLCHACGAKGGDILSFYRKITGKNFMETAISLGARGTTL